MSIDELFANETQMSRSGFANVFQASDTIKRADKDRYALGDWSGEEYAGIVPAMVERLEKVAPDALRIVDLARELADEYGVSQNSVSMCADMHHLFFSKNGDVRVRAAR